MVLHERLMSLQEYYEMYLGDLNMNLDSENLFPLGISVTGCLEYLDKGDLSLLPTKAN